MRKKNKFQGAWFCPSCGSSLEGISRNKNPRSSPHEKPITYQDMRTFSDDSQYNEHDSDDDDYGDDNDFDDEEDDNDSGFDHDDSVWISKNR